MRAACGSRVLRAGCALAALLGSGCEHGITLSGTVTVPAPLQRGVSPAAPALVVVIGSIPRTAGFGYRLGVLCAASENDVVLPLFHDGFGCAKEGTVRAQLVRPADGAVPACGVEQASWEGPLGDAVAAGEQVVFAGHGGAVGCSSGEDRVQIVLQPLP